MPQSSEQQKPHRRRNPLTGQWVLVSPQRDKRPWDGETESPATQSPEHDPDCYLCPGNDRAGGHVNPDYAGPWVFENDFPALGTETSVQDRQEPLLRSDAVTGACRVICYSPRHDLSLSQLNPAAVRAVIDAWAEQSAELGARYRWVQIFENRGAAMGCSNHHPHGQIWASDSLPNEPALEDRHQQEYFDQNKQVLLIDYATREQSRSERVVCANDSWIVVVPYWAIWPFETLVLPLRPVQRLQELDVTQRGALAGILQTLLAIYDHIFDTPFPYSMGWHGAPGTDDLPHWQLHAHFYPPLLRSADVRKFMVGYEMLAEPQRDMPAESAAEQLRDLAKTFENHA